jgi:HPr kinase/phosphorylase
VADDVVDLRCDDAGRVIGSAPARVRHYMEIRGVGIIFVPDLFGADRVRDEMEVQLACELVRWREGVEYERIGLDRTTCDVAGVQVPALQLPARPGASMATIVDVAAREHLKRTAGVNAAQRLDEQLRNAMRRS